MLNKVISITELATLTNKSRPTLYKYYSLYTENDKSDIPSAIVKLFDLVFKENPSRKEIVSYCTSTFSKVDIDIDIKEIVDLLNENKDKIDLKALKNAIKEGIKNGQAK